MPKPMPHAPDNYAHYVTVKHESGCFHVTFTTDIDMDIMVRIRPFLTKETERTEGPILVDLTRVSFLDSAAVSLLAHFFQHVQKRGQKMVILGAQDQPVAVLEMVGLADYVPLVPDMAAAKAALNDAA